MRVLLTGATGFLGRHLLHALGDHEVVALTRRAPLDAAAALDAPASVRFVQGDVLDAASVREAVAGCGAVIHAAGLVSHHETDAEAMWRVHVKGTETVLAAAREAGARRVVYLSTSGTVAVSEDRDFVAHEGSPTPIGVIQRWPYYRSKLFAERAALAFEGVDVVSLNPSLLLGPGDVNGSSTDAVRLFLDGQVLAAPPGGVSFADARDVAQVAVAALTQGRPGERYLLGAANMPFRLFYERLARISGRPAPRMRAPRALGRVLDWFPGVGRDGFAVGYDMTRTDLQMACHTWYLSDTKARRELGWAPRDPMRTLADTVDDVRWRMLAG